MIGKLKDILFKDILTGTLIIYCSGWVLFILSYFISDFISIINSGLEVYSSKRRGSMINFENIFFLGLSIFPLAILLSLMNITKAINRLNGNQKK